MVSVAVGFVVGMTAHARLKLRSCSRGWWVLMQLRSQAYSGLRQGTRNVSPGYAGVGVPLNGLNGVMPVRPAALPGHQLNMPPGARGNQF
jgi:hypothetical protein